VVEDFEAVERGLDIARKKEPLRLIFKRVLIDARELVRFEMYEPFQRMYNEVLIELKEKKDKELTSECSDECILVPMAGRCSGNIELSGPSGEGMSADTLLVFQALAEGL